MAISTTFLRLVITSSLLTGFTISIDTANYARLYNDVISSYNPIVPPCGNVTVTVGFTLTGVTEIDTYHGFLDTVGYLYMQWSDARLAWNASDYGNLESLHVPREMIWNPDIDVYNVAGPGMRVLNQILLAMIQPSGDVTLIPMVSIRTLCSKEDNHDQRSHRNQPFTCTIRVGSWTHSLDDIDLQMRDNMVDLSSMNDIPHFDILSTWVHRREVVYACCAKKYVNVDFCLTFKHK